MLAVIGPHWLNVQTEAGGRRLDEWNDLVRFEIDTALKQNKIVIPVLVGRAKMPAPEALPDALKPLARRNAFELSHNKFAADVEMLVATIKSLRPSPYNGRPKKDPDSEQARHKKVELRKLRAELLNAKESPLYLSREKNRFLPVFGEGDADADILVIGEGPGPNEAMEGRPFVGASGDLLDELLNSVNLTRQTIFLTNILMDFTAVTMPDGTAVRTKDGRAQKRDPLPDEVAYYKVYADRLIEVIAPRVIVTLGRFAMEFILRKYDLPERKESITRNRGKLLNATADFGPVTILPLLHPAVVFRRPEDKETLRQDILKLKAFL